MVASIKKPYNRTVDIANKLKAIGVDKLKKAGLISNDTESLHTIQEKTASNYVGKYKDIYHALLYGKGNVAAPSFVLLIIIFCAFLLVL